MNRAQPATFMVILGVLAIVGCGKKEGIEVARVNDAVLTLEEINRQIPPEYEGKVSPEQKEEFVDRWVNSEILYQEAIRRGIDEDEEVIRQLHQMTKDIIVAELIEQELKEMAPVSNEEVEKYYKDNLDEFVREEEEVRASHILLSEERQALEVKRELQRGANFAQLAAQLSLDEATSVRGGDIGFFSLGGMAPPIAEKAFSTPVGSVVGPVKSEYGYHLILVTDKKNNGTVRDLEQVKDKIFHELSALRQKEQLDRLVNHLRSIAQVEKRYHILWSEEMEDSLRG